jgi:hypothetical protein
MRLIKKCHCENDTIGKSTRATSPRYRRFFRTMIGVERAARVGSDEPASVPDRRRVMQALAGLFGMMSLAPAFASRAAELQMGGLEYWLRHGGAAALGDTAVLGHYGAIYLAEHTHERDRERLSRLLAGDGEGIIGIRLLEGIARDWREHEVVAVAGWVFARTEARICALLHLIRGADA